MILLKHISKDEWIASWCPVHLVAKIASDLRQARKFGSRVAAIDWIKEFSGIDAEIANFTVQEVTHEYDE